MSFIVGVFYRHESSRLNNTDPMYEVQVVEDIERTLPSHLQRQDDRRDITDDEETLSTMDWVDTTGRTAYNSTRVSRSDINQEENGQIFVATGKNCLKEFQLICCFF